VWICPDRHWIDREHLIVGGEQRGDPRATVGLDPHDHPALREHPRIRIDRGVVEMLGDQLVQPSHPGHALGQPSPEHPLAVSAKQHHVVVVLDPVITHEQASPLPPVALELHPGRQRGGDHRELMVKYSPTPTSGLGVRHPISGPPAHDR
jgi:hypothetical protein